MSEAGTSQTAGEWHTTRHDKKARQDAYVKLHGRMAPSHEGQFDAAMTAFNIEHKEELKSTGYQRDIFTMQLDSKYFEEYAKLHVDFEVAGFEFMVYRLILHLLPAKLLSMFRAGVRFQEVWWRATLVYSCLRFSRSSSPNSTQVKTDCKFKHVYTMVQGDLFTPQTVEVPIGSSESGPLNDGVTTVFV